MVLNGKIVYWGTLLKSVNAVRLSGISAFLESVSFHMWGATAFGLVLGNYFNDFYPKNILKLSRISFYELLKLVIIWAMFDKLFLVGFFPKAIRKF